MPGDCFGWQRKNFSYRKNKCTAQESAGDGTITLLFSSSFFPVLLGGFVHPPLPPLFVLIPRATPGGRGCLRKGTPLWLIPSETVFQIT